MSSPLLFVVATLAMGGSGCAAVMAEAPKSNAGCMNRRSLVLVDLATVETSRLARSVVAAALASPSTRRGGWGEAWGKRAIAIEEGRGGVAVGPASATGIRPTRPESGRSFHGNVRT